MGAILSNLRLVIVQLIKESANYPPNSTQAQEILSIRSDLSDLLRRIERLA